MWQSLIKLISICFLLTGCGQMGPLYLPKSTPTSTVTSATASQSTSTQNS